MFKQPTATCRTIYYYSFQNILCHFTSNELIEVSPTNTFVDLIEVSPNKYICKPIPGIFKLNKFSLLIVFWFKVALNLAIFTRNKQIFNRIKKHINNFSFIVRIIKIFMSIIINGVRYYWPPPQNIYRSLMVHGASSLLISMK